VTEPSPRSGNRDNGLRCTNYSAIGDLDPRVGEAMLEALRDHGIAAYVTPTPGSRGGYLEVRLPAEMTSRLFVDATKVDAASKIVGLEREEEVASPAPPSPTPTPTPGEAITASDGDIDAAWQQLLVSLQSPSSSEPPTWPSSEDVTTKTADDFIGEPFNLDEDEHFVPPAPPPVPKLRPVTVGALAAIIGGILVLVTQVDSGAWDWLAIIAIIVGGGSLAWHVKQGPPTDSGWDDGAVV
jgi:hypothetical protein